MEAPENVCRLQVRPPGTPTFIPEAQVGRSVGKSWVHGMMLALVVTWGIAFVSIKVLLDGALDPFQVTWYRYVPLLLAYGAWLLIWRRAQLRGLSGGDWGRVFLLGLLGVVGYHLPLYWGLQPRDGVEVTAATGAILIATAPLWTLLAAVGSRQERFDRQRAIGLFVAFAGVAVVTFLGKSGDQTFTFAGRVLVILIAPICWGSYSVVAKPLVDRFGGLVTTGLTMSVGTLLFLPYGIGQGIEPLRSLNTTEWLWLVYLSVFATAIGYAVWNISLRHLAATEVTAYIYLVPIVATLAGWWLRGEGVTAWFVAGSALILGGVGLVNRARTVARRAAANAAALAGASGKS